MRDTTPPAPPPPHTHTSTHLHIGHLEVAIFALSHCVHGLTRKLRFTCAVSCVSPAYTIQQTLVLGFGFRASGLGAVSRRGGLGVGPVSQCPTSRSVESVSSRYNPTSPSRWRRPGLSVMEYLVPKKQNTLSLSDAQMRCLQRRRPMPFPHVVHAPDNFKLSHNTHSLLRL